MKKTNSKRVFHLRRTGLLGLLLLAYFVVRVDAGGQNAYSLNRTHVLAYASEMSHGGLLAGTNAARSANGMGTLSLNSQLNSSAQMKAQDMANKDYWAHVAPDGTQPWYFFTQAGYSYIRAGENLAYGFNTSQGAVDGWMNSPSHRANILGDYTEVGFGFVNAPNYQSYGAQTIVVAHYGSRNNPVAAAPAPASPSSPVAQEPVSEPTPPPVAQEEPPVETPSPAEPISEAPPAQEKTNETAPADSTGLSPTPVQTGEPTQVSVLSMMANKNLPLAALASLVMVSFAVTGYALTHRAAFQHTVTNGEQFVIHHPGIDTGVIALVTSLILLTSYGNHS